ncbi:MAG: hypothetical protein EP336_09605 [Rhodobacteraceae bacterium]|nr:MAG: hypothetical protein EP336_09605 [Paracoccaceae bacterium]
MSDLKEFLRDVRDHKLTIELDQGIHRCLFLGRPGSSTYHYRLTTWPGHLAISGDMGSFTFSRLRDMFEFFRDEDMTNEINPSYWAQKVEAIDRHGSMKEFSDKKFRDAVLRDIEEWEVRLGDASKILNEVRDEVLALGCANVDEAYALINDFEASDGNVFTDFWEHDLTTYSLRYLWCLRAIVWGIKQYDLVTQGRTQADHDRRVLAGEL